MALIEIVAVSPPEHASHYCDCLKALRLKLNAKWQIQKCSDKEGGRSMKLSPWANHIIFILNLIDLPLGFQPCNQGLCQVSEHTLISWMIGGDQRGTAALCESALSLAIRHLEPALNISYHKCFLCCSKILFDRNKIISSNATKITLLFL